jgi:hypothetical protein
MRPDPAPDGRFFRLASSKSRLRRGIKLVNSSRLKIFACVTRHSSGINNSPRAVCG